MWFVGVEVEQETSAPPPKKHPGDAPEQVRMFLFRGQVVLTLLFILSLFIRALSQPGETWREHSLNIVRYLGWLFY